ncbi:MAG: response regulator [Bacteroidota bacterium]|nr:response regulator [Bacteroidota bacterium]
MKILLIDDEHWESDILQASIRLIGKESSVECCYADNPVKGLAMMDNMETNLPDYIFLDINLGGSYSCADTLAQLKRNERYSKIPVVIYTNEEIAWRKDFWKKSAAKYFLTKPNIDELMSVMRFLTNVRLPEDELQQVGRKLVYLN